MKAVKTYIRTKSGNLIERIVFMSEDDYKKFISGDATDILKKYLTTDEVENLDSWDKEEVRELVVNVIFCSGGSAYYTFILETASILNLLLQLHTCPRFC